MKSFLFAGAAAALLIAVPTLAQAPARHGAQPVTLAAMQARAQARFAQTDSNRDGFLTQAEIRAKAATRPTPEQRRARRAERLAHFDTDRDGTISPAERQAAVAARGGGDKAKRMERRGHRQAMRGARGLRINEQRFARLDADRDNRLSFAEVTARLAQRFQRLDSNRDGAVSVEERRSARAARRARRNG